MEIANLNGSSMLLSGMILQVPFGSKKRVQAAIQLSLALGMSGHPASQISTRPRADHYTWGEMEPFKILWSYKLVTGVLSPYFSLEPKLNGARPLFCLEVRPCFEGLTFKNRLDRALGR